jgi:hypothetical protein
VLAIFTTEGISFSAKSAKESGAFFAQTNELGTLITISIKQ